MIIVLAHYIRGDTLQERGEVSWVKWQGPIQALSTFPVVVFAYTCHQNVGYNIHPFKVSEEILIWIQMFSILNEIENNSHRSTTSVISVTIGTSVFVYILVAMTGYLSYGSNVNGNIISMCKDHSFHGSCYSSC